MRSNLISVCKKTLHHFHNTLKQSRQSYILISVKGGGCNGLKYEITPESVERLSNDELVVIENVPIVICGSSIMYLIGTELKWKTDIMGSGIEFNNPNAKSSCGCGDTFSA